MGSGPNPASCRASKTVSAAAGSAGPPGAGSIVAPFPAGSRGRIGGLLTAAATGRIVA